MVNCTECGACCLNFNVVRQHRVTLSTEDKERLFPKIGDQIFNTKDFYEKQGILAVGEEWAIKAVNGKNKIMMCSCLEGLVGKLVSCVVYEDRPQRCRNFLRGAASCKRAKQLFHEAMEG